MTRTSMREVAARIAEADIREVVFHPIHGLTVEYLSDEYFARLRYGLELAVEFGFRVWIYDEYGWPSGNAGGRLLREYPEHRGWILEFQHRSKGDLSVRPVQSDMLLDTSVGAPWTKGEPGYLDTLSPKAVQCFIHLTYDRVFHECGPLFQQAVAGFFTDEVASMIPPYREDLPGPWRAIGLPWTPQVPELFRERFGYDIEPRYLELAGDRPGQVKRDYWDLVKHLFAESYYGQIGRWCADHGVKFTGHAGEDSLLMQSRFSGSLYECLKHMDEPGIDFLGAGVEPDDRFMEMAVVSSIAKHTGKERVFCEAFGISPPDSRPGALLRRAQMLGLYGVNDLAVMGFHHDLSGIRKHIYWPPFFSQSHWWPHYAEFRDGVARSVGLTSMGSASVRYALLYPQDELEQTSVFKSIFEDTNVSSRCLDEIALAIYAAGETFDFIFPEILDEARTVDGRIVMPHGDYDALLVPSELSMLPEIRCKITELIDHGARVRYEPTERILAALSYTGPSWTDRLRISQDGKAGDIRVFQFTFPDGDLFALRNVTDREINASVSPTTEANLTEWEPETGSLYACRRCDATLPPYSTRYFSTTERTLTERSMSGARVRLNTAIAQEWYIGTTGLCVSRLQAVKFRHPDLGWLDAQNTEFTANDLGSRENGIPRSFTGQTRIEMSAEFLMDGKTNSCDRPGLIFEDGHLLQLSVNGKELDLSRSSCAPGWTRLCRAVGLHDCLKKGVNSVSAVLAYEEFETRLVSQAFYSYSPMPSADVFLLRPSCEVSLSAQSGAFPIEAHLGEWLPLDGTVNFRASVTVSLEDAARISGVAADPMAEDAVEVLLNGRRLGRSVKAPYLFEIDRITPGPHEVEIRISSPGAALFGRSSACGLRAVNWIIRK